MFAFILLGNLARKVYNREEKNIPMYECVCMLYIMYSDLGSTFFVHFQLSIVIFQNLRYFHSFFIYMKLYTNCA